MISDIPNLISDFKNVAALAGVHLEQGDIEVEELKSPHTAPSKLPTGKMAVYTFFFNGQCLKVGKAGPHSQARYTSQHYSAKSAPSTLAKSILKEIDDFGVADIEEDNVGKWIKENTDRVNFLVGVNLGIPVLTLLESFLQCRLRPRFEGFKSQR